jgi:hypothetical protein
MHRDYLQNEGSSLDSYNKNPVIVSDVDRLQCPRSDQNRPKIPFSEENEQSSREDDKEVVLLHEKGYYDKKDVSVLYVYECVFYPVKFLHLYYTKEIRLYVISI